MTCRMAVVGTVLTLLLPCIAQAGSEVLLNNASVRVALNTYAPGEPSGEHEHVAPRFVYVVSGGALQSEVGDNPPQLTDLVAGTCMYTAPVRHSVQNAGDTTLRLLEVEIKRASWHSDRSAQPCSGSAPKDRPQSSHVERTLLYAGSDFVASLITIPPGSRDRAGSIRGPRVVFVLDGGSLSTRLVGGTKAIATSAAALWVDEDAPLVNQDGHSALRVLELTPSSGGNGER